MLARSLLAAWALLAVAFPAPARIWNISPDGSGDVPTIQAGIDSSSAGDTVLLEDGVYTGSGNRNLDFLGKAITVRSQSGDPELCVLDVEFASVGFCFERGALFHSGEGSDTVLEGVKIMNIYGESSDIGGCLEGGAAIIIHDASPTLKRVSVEDSSGDGGFGEIVTVSGGSPRFEDCTLRNNGGVALWLWNTSATVTGCVIEANGTAGSEGAALVLYHGAPVIESTVIRRNRHVGTGDGPHAGGGVSVSGGTPSFDGCLITENTTNGVGGGMSVFGTFSLSITRTTIAGNRGAQGGGGLVGGQFSGSMSQSILWGNCADGEGSDALLNAGSNLTVDCSVVDPAGVAGSGSMIWGSGNVTEDPLFCEPRTCSDHQSEVGLYSLQLLSPARDTPSCGTLGALYDVCTVSLQPTSWGKIKASYREGDALD